MEQHADSDKEVNLNHARQAEALLSLHKISLALQGQFDLKKLLQKITEQAAQLLETNSGGLYLYDESTQALELVISHNLGPSCIPGTRLALGEGLAGRVAERLQPIAVSDYLHWEGRLKPQCTPPIQSGLAVPLLCQSKLVGVLSTLELEKQRTFSEENIQLLQLFGDQAAAAICNAQSHASLVKSEALYRTLVESALVAVYLNRDDKVIYANQRACELSGYPKDELIGLSVKNFICPQDRDPGASKSSGDNPDRNIAKVIRKDGQIIEVEYQNHWIDLEGQKTLIGTAVDITSQRETERLRRRLGQIGHDILAISDLRKIIEDVVTAVVSHSPFKAVGVSIYDRPVAPTETKGYRIQDAIGTGLSEEQMDELVKRTLSGKFLPHHKILAKGRKIGQISYYVQEQDLPEITEHGIPSRDSASAWGPYDMLFVLLSNGDCLLGRIGLAKPIHGQLPTPEEIEPLEILANMAALAIDKAQRMSALHTALDQVQHTNRFFRALSEARDLEELLAKVIHRGIELIPKVQGGSVLLLDEREEVFKFCAAVGRNLAQLAHTKFPWQEAIRALRLDQGPQILTHSIQAQGDLALITKELGEPPAATIILPIKQGDKIVGFINFNNFEEESAFGSNDLKTIAELLPEIELALMRAHEREQLREQALRDPLTGVYNRRYLTKLVSRELEHARHYGHPFAFLMIDFDNFFAVNDRFGHLVGDRVLYEIAQLLQKTVRASDAIVRYGGDEFLVVLLETDRREATVVARRLEKECSVWLKEFQRKHGRVKLSISVGLACWTPESKKEIEAVLDEADQFMYRRKRRKRHRAQTKARKRSR
ncbi:diguanylate cyclase [Candidatus Acetothermia bacterium]|nr:diguanylate cyclase [Candidatus Acetothermia bacterium]